MGFYEAVSASFGVAAIIFVLMQAAGFLLFVLPEGQDLLAAAAH